MCFVCCTNWQDEYKKRLAEASEPIMGKIDFYNEKYAEIDKYANSISYEDLEKVRLNDAKMILESLPKETKKEYHLDEFIILNIPDSGGIHINDQIFYNSDEEYGEEYSYYKFFNDDFIFNDITSENQMNYYLSKFEERIVKPLKAAKYLLIIKDKILVEPDCPVYGDEFTNGYVFSGVDVYDLDSKQLIDRFDVAATNSNTVKVETDLSYSISKDKVDVSGTGFIKNGNLALTEDLYSCLKENAKSKAKDRLMK